MYWAISLTVNAIQGYIIITVLVTHCALWYHIESFVHMFRQLARRFLQLLSTASELSTSMVFHFLTFRFTCL